jgi:hypothetical protein
LVVSTIHAFCQRLLATYPLEAGLHPRFEVDADGARIQALAEDVVEEALRNLDEDPNRNQWERLAMEGVGPAKIVEALCQLVEAGVEPEVFGEDPFDDRAAGVVAQRLLSALNRIADLVGDRLDTVSGSVSESTRDDIVELRRRVAGLDPATSMNDLAAVADRVSPKTVPRLKKWSRLDFTGSEKDCLGDKGYEVAAASAGRSSPRPDGRSARGGGASPGSAPASAERGGAGDLFGPPSPHRAAPCEFARGPARGGGGHRPPAGG